MYFCRNILFSSLVAYHEISTARSGVFVRAHSQGGAVKSTFALWQKKRSWRSTRGPGDPGYHKRMRNSGGCWHHIRPQRRQYPGLFWQSHCAVFTSVSCCGPYLVIPATRPAHGLFLIQPTRLGHSQERAGVGGKRQL